MREFKINPLNVVGSRRTECLLPHMSLITFNYDLAIKTDYLSWIESNLKGRFWIGTVVKLVNNRTMIHNAVAFEDPYESTLFLLGCPDAAKSKV